MVGVGEDKMADEPTGTMSTLALTFIPLESRVIWRIAQNESTTNIHEACPSSD
jgi:hypothetical protein